MTLDLDRLPVAAADETLAQATPASPSETEGEVRESSLNRLTTLLRIADGAWALAIYASATVRSQMIEELTARLAPLPVVELSLAAGPVQLFDYLRQLPADAPPLALMCHSYGDGLSPLLRSLDLQRDALARLPHRLVFWVNSYERRQFLELAPNFTSRLSGTFRFPGAGPGSAPVTTAGMLQRVTSDSSNSAVRRRPYLAVRNARHREEQISYLRQRIHDLQQMARRDDEAIGDAWYDLAGLLESGEPRRWADAEAAYFEAARAYACAGRSLAEAEARYRAGDAANRAYQAEAAHQHLARALHQYRLLSDTAATTPDAVLGEANVQKALGDLALREDELGEARRRYEAALAIYPVIGARLGEANVQKALGDLALREAELGEARRRYEAALAIYPVIGDRLGEANVLQALGDLALREAELGEARRRYEAALAIYPVIGDRLGEANVQKALGDLALREAELGEARRRYEAALAIYPVIGDRLGEANVQKALGDLALREDELGEARRRYEAALAIYPVIGDRLGEANVQKALGDLALREDELGEARRRYEAALAIYPVIGDRLGEANVQKALGDLALREAELGEARRRYEAALAIYPVIGDRLGEANANLSLGDLCRQTQDFEQAWRHYLFALRFYTQVQDRYSVARVLYRQGDWHAEQGHVADARGHYLQAIELWQSIGAANLAEQIIIPRLRRLEK